MNNSNNTANEDIIKNEYVNPLNPNEVLGKNENINIVEENNNVSVPQNNTETTQATNNDTVEVTINKKGGNKILIVIVVLFVIAIIASLILVIPKIFTKEEEKPPIVEVPKQESAKITLSDIVTNSTNGIYYKFLTSKYDVNITNNDNSIVFNLNNEDINKQILFKLDNRNLKLVINKTEENEDELNALYIVFDGIGQYYGHDINEVANYLYTIQDNYNFNKNGIITTEENDTIEILINIDTNISTNELNSMYFNLDELNAYKENIINDSIDVKKGNLVMYTISKPETQEILIGERQKLTSNSYNTITSIVELLYPEEINDFKSKFTTISNIAFDKYKIVVDPEINDIYTQYQDSYKFVLIEISKQV